MRLRDLASSAATALTVVLVTFLAYVAGAWAAWFDSLVRSGSRDGSIGTFLAESG